MLVQKKNIPSSYSSKFFFIKTLDYKQLLDEVFVISGIIKINQGRGECYQPSQRTRLITLTSTLIQFRISQKPNLITVLLNIVLKKITTKTPLQGT